MTTWFTSTHCVPQRENGLQGNFGVRAHHDGSLDVLGSPLYVFFECKWLLCSIYELRLQFSSIKEVRQCCVNAASMLRQCCVNAASMRQCGLTHYFIH
jgi:hypothetical protein